MLPNCQDSVHMTVFFERNSFNMYQALKQSETC